MAALAVFVTVASPTAVAATTNDLAVTFPDITKIHLVAVTKLTDTDAADARTSADADTDGTITQAEADDTTEQYRAAIEMAIAKDDFKWDEKEASEVKVNKPAQHSGLAGSTAATGPVTLTLSVDFSYPGTTAKAEMKLFAKDDGTGADPTTTAKFESPSGYKIKSQKGVAGASFHSDRTTVTGTQDAGALEIVYEKKPKSGGGLPAPGLAIAALALFGFASTLRGRRT